ncbi:DUF3105 domain-containing protein [Microbacterium sp. cx-55]|uniref:DUF3105 domain-containing protein n=1 Tax=Microbacterium sp. cx-55 TaxID=2875948 RepID=UPI001CBC4F1A|nr:DUF3105 domain-containing protein [Microbacterium sp. cx-55]MBZ4487946.1 DUF3105 domain-containing protein [Microbacterium sp. cx-55]UGB34644.1 DUF3105 domain-containing protein [Microbacterium sp. cx-55]
MSTTPDKRRSGNPAEQAKIALTAKQEREQRRQEKLAEYQRQVARRKRGKLVWWIVGSTAALLVVAVVVASIVFTPRPVTYGAQDSTGAVIDGVETFENVTTHVEGTVDYDQSPPAGGPHAPIWLNCGVYNQPVPNENAVHSMEHGAVWVTYDASRVGADEVAALRAQLPSSYALLTPYEGLDSPIVLSAWNAQLKVDSAEDSRIPEFFEEYWRSQNAPEPNAVCSGGVDAEGRQ